ncbi:MAG TPA: TonB family protein, partial [Sphingomonas sp.]|nr:TonB family protein [Sphingomonas sp.]
SSREKALSGIVSAAVVGVVGYAMVSGLAVTIIHRTLPDLIVHNYSEAPPPPPRQAPPPNEAKAARPMPIPTPSPREPKVVPLDLPKVFPLPPLKDHIDFPKLSGAGETVRPPVSRAADAQPKQSPSEWLTTDDYPPSALRAGEEGRTGFTLSIGADGRVTACSVTRSSGSEALDNAACRIITRRARFTPARDAEGRPTAGSYANSVSWRLPER